jgi:defect-in-organelle-trafficking protein DotC
MAALVIDPPVMTLEHAQHLYERPAIIQPTAPGKTADPSTQLSATPNMAQKARAQALLDTALGVGVKAGLAWQLHNVRIAINGVARDLDLLYNFQPLMIHQRVVPPVISEARNLYNQDDDYTVRLSGAYYKIERQATFASVAPSWRAYLSFPLATPNDDRVLSMLLPANSAERAAWELAIKDGWDQGVAEANLMLTRGMDRLNRDFNGMSRFHRFVLDGKISLPAIAREDIPVTQSGASMAVDETLLRITTLPQFDAHLAKWQGTVISNASPARANSPAPPPALDTDARSAQAKP